MIRKGVRCIWQNVEPANLAFLNGSECICTQELHFRDVNHANGRPAGVQLVYGTDTVHEGREVFAMFYHLREKEPPKDEFEEDILRDLEDKI